MAPQTRANYRRGTPPTTLQAKEADTLKKTRFFNAFDAQTVDPKIRPVARATGIPYPTARRWLQQRLQLGSSAYRRTRQLSTRLGRPSTVTESDVQRLIHAPQEVRQQPLAAQLTIHDIHLSERQARRKIKEYSNNAQRYKAAYYKDDLSSQNEADRTKYGILHRGKSIEDFWSYILFTDEFHYNPSLLGDPIITREEGTRYEDDNIVARPPKGASFTLHGAGWVNWHAKCDRLIFWQDVKAEKVTKEQTQELKRLLKEKTPRRPQKPRRSKFESSQQWQDRLDQYSKDINEWQLSCPQPVISEPKGNSMTEAYYTKHILPIYIAAVKSLQEQFHHDFFLEEDGDSSHGTRTKGLATQLRERHGIRTHWHPAYSPDLSPIEAAWNILKQRLRRIPGASEMGYEDLINLAQEVWQGITIQEIRDRISDMPRRCDLLVETGGKRIKGQDW